MKIKRWEKYNGDSKQAFINFIEALKDFKSDCKDMFCYECRFCKTEDMDLGYCFASWLMEEIEVEDNENV